MSFFALKAGCYGDWIHSYHGRGRPVTKLSLLGRTHCKWKLSPGETWANLAAITFIFFCARSHEGIDEVGYKNPKSITSWWTRVWGSLGGQKPELKMGALPLSCVALDKSCNLRWTRNGIYLTGCVEDPVRWQEWKFCTVSGLINGSCLINQSYRSSSDYYYWLIFLAWSLSPFGSYSPSPHGGWVARVYLGSREAGNRLGLRDSEE